VRLKVWKGGFLTVSWAHPDYTHAKWERFQNQPVTLVFEPFQRLNGSITFEGHPNAADDLRRVIEKTTGQYSQGDYALSSSIDRVELSLCDVNADALTLVNGLRYLDKNHTLTGEIEVSSFRTGDLEDYCRFEFRAGETWMARPILWADIPEESKSPVLPLSQAA
jgi:hypothetical protein